MTLSVITITGQRQSGKTTAAINLANRLTQRHGVAYMGWDEVPHERLSPSVAFRGFRPVTKLSHNAIVDLNDTLVKVSMNDSRVTDVLVLDNVEHYFHRANGLDDPKQHIIDTLSPLIGIKLLIMVMSTVNPTTNDPYIQASDIHMHISPYAGINPLEPRGYIESCSNKPVLYSEYDDFLQSMLIDAIGEERISPNVFSLETLQAIGYAPQDEDSLSAAIRSLTRRKR